MDMQDMVDRLIAVGRTDLAERLKHLSGKHNQSRHGWRFARGGDDAARLGAARRSMRGRDAGERAEYRKRAGMPKAEQRETSVYDRAAAQYELRGNRPNTVSAARATAMLAANGNKLAETELMGFGKDAITQLTNEETLRGTPLGDYLRGKKVRGLSNEPTEPETPGSTDAGGQQSLTRGQKKLRDSEFERYGFSARPDKNTSQHIYVDVSRRLPDQIDDIDRESMARGVGGKYIGDKVNAYRMTRDQYQTLKKLADRGFARFDSKSGEFVFSGMERGLKLGEILEYGL